MQEFGKVLIFLGIISIVVGAVLYFGWGRVAFGWMGHLPGDIRVERPNSGFYFPIVTCIVLSILLTVIFQLVHWMGRR